MRIVVRAVLFSAHVAKRPRAKGDHKERPFVDVVTPRSFCGFLHQLQSESSSTLRALFKGEGEVKPYSFFLAELMFSRIKNNN